MENLKFLGTLMAVGYLTILFRLFPKGRRSFDVFKLNPKLLPFWMKYIGLLWLIFIITYSEIYIDQNFADNILLLVGVHFGLTIIAFSREKNEDEFAAQIRMKAMYIAVISLFFFSGLVGAIQVRLSKPSSVNMLYFFMMFFNATLIVYLIYFYFTKYWSIFKKNR